MRFALVIEVIPLFIIFILIFAFLNLGTTKIADLNDKISEHARRLNDRLKSSISIEGIVQDNNDSSILYVNITNNGSISIKFKDIEHMDVIIVYFDQYNLKHVNRLSYSDSGEDGTWKVISIFTRNGSEEIINPLYISSHSGLWDPYEKLEIKINLNFAVNISNGLYLLIALPNGIKDSYSEV